MSGTPQVDADCSEGCSTVRRPSTTCTMLATGNRRRSSTSSSSRAVAIGEAFGTGFLKGWQKVPAEHPERFSRPGRKNGCRPIELERPASEILSELDAELYRRC